MFFLILLILDDIFFLRRYEKPDHALFHYHLAVELASAGVDYVLSVTI